jgi:hypothetical protein
MSNFCVKALCYVGFEVFTEVTMKNAVFWDVTPCRSCVNRRFGGTYRLHLQCRIIRELYKRLRREADHSPPSCAEGKNTWACTSIPP